MTQLLTEKPKFWKQQDGTLVNIKEMSETHLTNAISMIERKHQREVSAAWSVLFMLQGEVALEQCERDIDFMEEEGPECLCPSNWGSKIAGYADLCNERDFRKDQFKEFLERTRKRA